LSERSVEPERARRIGLNEAVFREINEQLQQLAEQFRFRDEPLDLVCECGNAECEERIRLAAADYQLLRADPAQFAVVPGHELEDVETVVRGGPGYAVVRKNPGVPEEVASATDPRNGGHGAG
jgi:hypothetical protein